MKKIVLLIPALLLMISGFAGNENRNCEESGKTMQSIANRSFQLAGNSLVAINNLVLPDTVESKDTVAPIKVKKGMEPLLQLAPKGKKVFLVAEDKGVVAHAEKNINYWHFWQVTDNKDDADFVLEIKFRYGNLGRSFTYAIFYDKVGNEVYSTHEVDNFANADLNFKRSAVNNLIDNVVKPMFEL